MFLTWIAIFLLVTTCFNRKGFSVGNIVQVSPTCHGNTCSFDWTIDYTTTMVWFNRTAGTGLPVVPIQGRLYKREVANCTNYTPLAPEELAEVNTAEGDYRQAIAVNGKIPGPPIVVIEGQTVVVNVFNKLINEAVTIHWHGLLQRGTPWMDGVSMVSQCPIHPNQLFQYRFKAYPAGTHWYHAHQGAMRTDGLAGALIILPKPVLTPAPHMVHPVPHIDGDFYALVQEWSRNGSLSDIIEFDYVLFTKAFGYNVNRCHRPEEQPDGTDAGVLPFNAAIINGKGRRFPIPGLTLSELPEVPLEVFTVYSNGHYKIRFVNIGGDYPFRISIDSHSLTIVAFDGNEVEMQTVDAVIIAPAESVDVIIQTVAHISNYWIRVETTAVQDAQERPIHPQKTLGILHYEGAPLIEPMSSSKTCTEHYPCTVANCPFGIYPAGYNIICLPIVAFKSTPTELTHFPVPIPSPHHPLQEFFLNFHFPRLDPTIRPGSSINGKVFAKPFSALQTYPPVDGPKVITPCDPAECQEMCECTHMIKLNLGHTIQMVLFINDTVPFRLSHPVHLHGHHFHVLKVGYPDYDPVTGDFRHKNRDITCLDRLCTAARWTNPSWYGGNIPGLNEINPPLKDTVSVPYGGYVVIRFLADNPGFWFLHCHLHIHLHTGMSLVMEEGDMTDMPPLPQGFPTCPSFHIDGFAFEEYMDQELARQRAMGLGGHGGVGTQLVTYRDQTCLGEPWLCKKTMSYQ